MEHATEYSILTERIFFAQPNDTAFPAINKDVKEERSQEKICYLGTEMIDLSNQRLGIPELSRMFDVVFDLSNAKCGITFTQS